MSVRHPALGQTFDPGYVDVTVPYYGYSETGTYSGFQDAVSGASSTIASGVAAGAPLDVTLVNAGGAATTAVVGASASAATAAIAIPVIGAAVAGITFWLMRNRINNIRKEKATEVVNTAENKMKENLEAYMSGPRTVSSQRQALANFDALWDFIVRGCAAVGGDPGRRCIEERQRGGSAPWCPTGTGCDYFTLYRDPIANDSPVKDSLSIGIDMETGQVVSLTSMPSLIVLALAGAGIWLLTKKEEDD